ncbi:sulfite exporter TauE/SafE family protein [Tatlockia micdadei]|uniref:sulfite exporter TauE/SafE family protein n=1 Tax=Legionella micdadei TaxID=451 RepID=UPI001570B713|nr:sulfite exporter TauE/SafE family protein [Legionella micdadei]NSL19414.1 sulfite exporter TauE/SafE family protein [Legionella micdadei]
MSLIEILSHGSLYILAGIAAGLVSGIMGIGGGIVVVPALAFIFNHKANFPQELVMQMAAATSLAVMLFTSQSSIRTHYKQSGILWSVYQRLWPGIVVGAISGALLSHQLSTFWLRMLFGFFLLFVSIKMLADMSKKEIKPYHFPPTWVNWLINFFIGCIAGLLGVGGGALTVPYLSYCNLEIIKIAPISALSTLTVAAVGTVVFIITGANEPGLPAYSTGFVYWPAVLCIAIPSSFFAPLGAKLTYVVPVKQLKYGFIALLIVTAIDLLVIRTLF